MNTALWTLLWLNFRAFLRRIGRQLRTPRGIIFFVIGIGVLGGWIVRTIFFNFSVPSTDPHQLLSTVSAIILLVCVMNLFTSIGERAVTFTPAEVDFLFPGPFSRRSLLTYKLIKTGLGTLMSALIYSVLLARFGGTFVFRFGGIWLLFQFMQLLAMTLALVQTIVGERFLSTGRWWILVLLVVMAVLAMAEVYQSHHEVNFAMLSQARETRAGRIMLAPFSVFARTIFARNIFPEFAKWATIAAGIDLAMAAAVVLLDANYLETAATISARRYDRVSRMRRSGLAGLAKPMGVKWKVPMLPWAGGTGPLVWRHLTTALRTARSLLIFLSIVAVVAGIGLSRAADKEAMIGLLVGSTVWLNLFLSQMLKFDFRGDLDQFDVLLSLPLRPAAVAAAQLVAPALVLSIVQLVLLVTIGIVGGFPLPYLITAAFFVPSLALLTIATDNLIFLLFPVRATAAVAGDMGLVGRQSIVFACRLVVLVSVAGITFGVGALVWFITGHSWNAAAVAAWFPLAAAIGLIVWIIGIVFQKFDPSVCTPT